MNDNIHAAAQSLAAAEHRQQQAADALAAAKAERDQVDRRIALLDARRAEIVARRSRGEHQADDGATLALLDADKQGLVGILAEAEAVVTAARAPHEAAKQAVATARYAMQRAEDESAEEALIAHATRLDELMAETLGQLDELGRRLKRGRSGWAPSRALADAVRRLDLQAGAAR